MRHRLNRELMVLASGEKHRVAVSLPAGKLIEILGPAEDDRFIRIHVDGELAEAFEIDVLKRGQFVKSRSRVS